MSADINKRLRALDARRHGFDRSSVIFDSASGFEARAHLSETYQKRSSGYHTRYALGAMQAVAASYTALSVAEAERVQAQIA
ncbi:hypothetical protein V3O09_19645, partial [Stenotrophomonas maltophilia]|uniref:hypothetical protein n=6 Tax=cellular organisms TaxID=131567 RepID=UPI003525EC43